MRGSDLIICALSFYLFLCSVQVECTSFERFKLDGQNDSNLEARGKKVAGVYITFHAKKKKKNSPISIATGLPPELLETIQEARKNHQCQVTEISGICRRLFPDTGNFLFFLD